MIDIVKLLLRCFALYKGGHPLYVPANEIRDVHHLYLGKMHEKPDVISIKRIQEHQAEIQAFSLDLERAK